MSVPLVIHHGSCFDGVGAAWVFKELRGDAEFFAARYGKEPPSVAGRDVWIVDFSYPRATLEQMLGEANSLLVVDHHKTAQEALTGFANAVFDMDRSGCGLLWDYLVFGAICVCESCGASGYRDEHHHSGCPVRRPWLVNYIEDRDLWRQALPNTREVSAWVAAQPYDPDAYAQVFAEGFDAAVAAGRAVERYIEKYGQAAAAHARTEALAGFTVPTVNIAYMNCSEHLARMLEQNPDAPFVASYFRRDDGRWQFSLRSRPGFDVSAVAKEFGGGGHVCAAGFDVAALPWGG